MSLSNKNEIFSKTRKQFSDKIVPYNKKMNTYASATLVFLFTFKNFIGNSKSESDSGKSIE